MQDRSPKGSRKSRSLSLPVALLALALSLMLLPACCSLSKPALERELRALGKNASAGELSRLTFRADLGQGEADYGLVYEHSPALEDKGRTPVVLIHNTPSTLFSWSELVHGSAADASGPGWPGLRADRDVYALEIIGHGIAPPVQGPLSFERCARFIVQAIRELGLQRVLLVGSSYGGEFAWRAALHAPELVEGLVLLDSSGYQRKDGEWLPEEVVMRENSLAGWGWLLNSRARIEVALAPHFQVLPPDRVEEFFLVAENASNWRAMIDLVRDENGTREAEIKNLQAPTLLIWGADDLAYDVEAYGRRFERDIKGSQLVVLPETGHYPHEERPQEVLQLLSKFFASLEASQ